MKPVRFQTLKKPMALCAMGLIMILCLAFPKISLAQNNNALANNAYVNDYHDIASKNGTIYRIFMASPKEPAPKDGWPLIILLDGNSTFPLALAEIAKAKYPRAIILGIGYPTPDKAEIVKRRYFDLTTFANANKIPTRDNAPPPKTGGEAEFRQFIVDYITDEVLKHYSINDKAISLFGHSLGGLFVMHTLLSQNHMAFNAYCAADPSIWWNGHEFMTKLTDYQKPKDYNHRLLIETSGLKTSHNTISDSQQKAITDMRSGRNGKDVSEILKSKFHIENHFYQFFDKNHGTMLEPSIQDCLAFVLNNQSPNHSQ